MSIKENTFLKFRNQTTGFDVLFFFGFGVSFGTFFDQKNVSTVAMMNNLDYSLVVYLICVKFSENLKHNSY
jgi:hypothetical protein